MKFTSEKQASHFAMAIGDLVIYPLVVLLYVLAGWLPVIAYAVVNVLMSGCLFYMAARREYKAGASG